MASQRNVSFPEAWDGCFMNDDRKYEFGGLDNGGEPHSE